MGFFEPVYQWLAAHYDLMRGLHILAVIAWMAGLLYLPRLYVYHTQAPRGSTMDETFATMERRLLKGIMNPAMWAACRVPSRVLFQASSAVEATEDATSPTLSLTAEVTPPRSPSSALRGSCRLGASGLFLVVMSYLLVRVWNHLLTQGRGCKHRAGE